MYEEQRLLLSGAGPCTSGGKQKKRLSGGEGNYLEAVDREVGSERGVYLAFWLVLSWKQVIDQVLVFGTDCSRG